MVNKECDLGSVINVSLSDLLNTNCDRLHLQVPST